MGKNNIFNRFFIELNNVGIRFTKEFCKDITKLITSNIEESLFQILKDFKLFDIQNMNRFEKLKLTSKQYMKIENLSLYRYEYRKNSNLRIIFILFHKNEIIFVSAFNENNGKRKSKDSYDKNIERAINIILRLRDGDKNEN